MIIETLVQKILLKSKDLPSQIASLEILVVLLKEDNELPSNEMKVRELVSYLGKRLVENRKNMDFIMPSIAVLLALRDKSCNHTIEAILSLPQKQGDQVIHFAKQFAPDLEESIENYKNSLLDFSEVE